MEVDVSEVCRACLSHQEEMFSLYGNYEHGLTLAAILKSCINAEVHEGDGFPSCLCNNCTLILTQFYNFAVVYEESDKQLRAVLQKPNKVKDEVEGSNSNSCEDSAEINDLQYRITNENNHNSTTILNPYQGGEVTNSSTNYYNDSITDILQYNNAHEDYRIKVEAADITLSADEDYNSNEPQYPQENVSIQTAPRYQCEICSEVYLYEEYYLEHMELYHNENSTANKNNNSDDLQNNEDSVNNMESEEIRALLNDPTIRVVTKYECDTCGEAYLYKSSFQSHMRTKHKLDDIDCDNYCTRTFIKVDPKPHRKSTRSIEANFLPSMERPYGCDQCSRRFRQPHMLEHHKELHSGKKKFVCDVCGKGFVRKTYLDDHMEGHSSVKRHVCKFCGKAFQRRTVLRAHKRTHTHPNFYVCDQCGRGFTSTSTLKTHKKLIHIRERNFKCVICNQTFPLKSTLAKHIRRHINKNKVEKDFPCSLCEMQYRDKSSLKRHVEIKHLGKGVVVTCPDCPKQYTSKANLIKHRRKHHTGVVTD